MTTTTNAGASEHVERYEALRGRAIDPHHAPTARDGLAVLLRQGMASWIQAWSTLPAPAAPSAQNNHQKPPLPDGASAEVVRILADMALGHIQNNKNSLHTSCN